VHVPSILVKIIDRLYQHMGELFDVGLHIPVISICIHIGIYIYIYNYPRVEFTRFLIISELTTARDNHEVWHFLPAIILFVPITRGIYVYI
jgi:hypothetical protein